MNQPTESEFLDDVGLKKPDRSLATRTAQTNMLALNSDFFFTSSPYYFKKTGISDEDEMPVKALDGKILLERYYTVLLHTTS